MSAFVINNPAVTEGKFADAAHLEPSIKQVSWRKRKKHIFLAVFVALLLATVIALAVYFTNKDSAQSTSPQFKEMEGDMKKSVDPCYDFYEYSCGKYIDRHLPDRNTPFAVYIDKFASLIKDNTNTAHKVIEGMGSSKDPFFKKAFTYYKACMGGHDRTMGPYFKAADAVGGSDMTTIGSFDYSKWSLEEALKNLYIQYNANPLFTVHVSHDLWNSSRNVLMIKAPDFTVLSKMAGEDDGFPHSWKRTSDVLDYDIETISSAVMRLNTQIRSMFATSASTRTGKSYMYTLGRILNAGTMETTLISNARTAFLGATIRKIYKVVKVRELDNITDYKIRWSTLLQSLSPSGSSFNVNNDTEIGLMVPQSYLKSIKTFVSYSNRRKLPDFFTWFLLKKFSPVLPDTYFAQYYFGSPASSMGEKGKEKWRACMLETEITMPLSVGMMFAKNLIAPLVENTTHTMLAEIKNAFRNGSKQLTWLDQVTKTAVEDKINHVLELIAGPHLFKPGRLNDIYKDLTVAGKTYPEIFESSQRYIVQINLKRYFQRPKRNQFDFGGTIPKLYDVNAFYDRSKNLIMVLSGIMRPPFIYKSGPNYINFAKVGAILGHELLHGFDSMGWHFDKTGQISQWTTKHSQNGFSVRANCVKSQYGRYFSGSKFINGTKTLAENIADNAGLKYAYLAYKNMVAQNKLEEEKPPGLKSLSYDQLFFIGYAQMWCRAASNIIKDHIAATDTHSPNRYRVIGSVSNFKPFADAFKCSRGSQMNPISRCEFW